MGNCCLDGYIDGLGQEADAVGCFSACIAKRPDFPAAYVNRGLMRLRRGLYEEAEVDFTRAVELRPGRADYLLKRARARDGLHHNQEEVDDLNQAEELGSKSVLLYYFRAATQQRMGHDVSARRDLDRVLHLTPDDEEGFVARGMARASDGDSEGALADFSEAVKRNPNSVTGLQDQGICCRRRSTATARRWRRWTGWWTCTRRSPGGTGAGRGAGAAGDARRVLGGPPKGAEARSDQRRRAVPGRLDLRAFGREREADRAEAFRMLCRALQTGYGWTDVEHDDDLASLRKTCATATWRGRPECCG